jgi:hypothetical protein
MSAKDKNLTGEQIQLVMDSFLYKALQPIVMHSDIFDDQISHVISIVSLNRKRKLSAVDRDVLVADLCHCLVTTDRAEKFEVFKRCRIERSFVHIFVNNFLQVITGFREKYNDFLIKPDRDKRNFLENMAHVYGFSNRTELYKVALNSSAYLEAFYQFRGEVLNNYLKHSSTQAKSYMSSTNGTNIDFNDLRQSILRAVITALDKYDSTMGALTTYINWWIRNAQTCSSDHEYGIAYTVPQSQKRRIADGSSTQNNFSVSMDALVVGEEKDLHEILSDQYTLDGNVEEMEYLSLIKLLVKSVDPDGIARLLLDIDEIVSPDDLKVMHSHMASA